MQDTERIAAQIELEKAMTEQSIRDYQREYQQTVDRGGLGQPETKLISYSLDPYIEAINRYLDKYNQGKVTHRPVAASKLLDLKKILSLDQVAFIAAQSIFCTLNQQANGQKIAKRIGNALDAEEKFKKYKQYNLAYYDAVLKELNSRNARIDWKLTTLNHSFSKKFNYHCPAWTHQQLIQVGLILLELFIESTGYAEWHKIWERGRSYNYVVPTRETLQWIENEHTKLEVLNPFYLPMICPPKDWTGVYDGGYISPYIRKSTLIKQHEKSYLRELDKRDMPEVYSAINSLQATSWRVNTKILNVIKELWEMNRGLAGLPDREDVTPPPYPYPQLKKDDYKTPEQQAIIRSWKNEAVAAYKRNIQVRSLRLLTAQIIKIAEQFSQYDKIWFPYNMDFRGRLYPIPVLFQPQGNDLAKGLLQFAEGKALETEEAVNWLRIHGANCYGIDKVSYAERVQWIKDREQEIREYAEDPITNTEWAKADKPIQFLAFCQEYINYLDTGYSCITHLVVYVDGTCNGLQHYSAILRDEVGGKAVNLIDSDKPSDIYGVVAEKLKEKLTEDVIRRTSVDYNRNPLHSSRNNLSRYEQITGDTDNVPCSINSNSTPNNDSNSLLSRNWLDLGINRKLTKRPVMVLPYGGTKQSCREYIEEYLKEHYSLTFLHEHFNYIGKQPTDTVFKATLWLSNLLWKAIEDTLRSAIVGMSYIRKKLTGHKKEAIEWVTPTGLLIRQKYPNTKIQSVATELFGKIKRWEVMTNTKGINSSKQTNGICPNFIHSMDASALMKYINKAVQQGIRSFGAVHDSYGTLATDVTLSQKLLREAFVEMYRVVGDEKCILEKFIEDITGEPVKDLPTKGSLDIEEVLKSRYFFN